MSTWILAAVVLHFAYIFTPTLLFAPQEGVVAHMGGRDRQPEPSAVVGRARRALANWQESLPVFMALALAALASNVDSSAGAMVFLGARVVYLPLYLGAVPFVRTLVWAVSLCGLAAMAWPLV